MEQVTITKSGNRYELPGMTVVDIIDSQQKFKDLLNTEKDFDNLVDNLYKLGLDLSNNRFGEYYLLANTERVNKIREKFKYPHSKPVLKGGLWNLYQIPTFRILEDYTKEEYQQYVDQGLSLEEHHLIPYQSYSMKFEDFQ